MADGFISGGGGNDTLRGGTRSVGGSAKSRGLGQVDPRLIQVIDAAAARSPYDVQIFSGIRQGSPGGSRHNTGNAVDIALIDPSTGQVIPNYKSSTGFPIYAEFAKVAREEQMRIAPDMANDFRWGGGFSDKDFDLMHFDFKPGGAMAYWTWEDGGKLTAAGAEAVPKFGPGYVYANGERYRAPEGQYASLWGRDPLTPAQPAFNMASISPTTAKLAGVMLAEARGEGRDGMLGVGNVVLNRTNTAGTRFPKTLDEAINGEFAKPLGPNDVSPDEWKEAVQLAMGIQAGVIPDNTDGAVYFANAETANPNAYNLIKASGPATVTIGNHTFHKGDSTPVSRPSPVANIVQAREATAPTMATRAPPAPPPVMTPTPPPFALEGSATAGQGNGATATGVLPPAVPTPRSRPLGGGPVAPPPTMASTPAPFKLEGSASTGQGASASATGTLPSVVPTPRERPQQFRTGTAYLPGPKMTAAPYPYDEPPGFERLGKPNMAVSSPLAANKPVVQPLPPAPAPQPAPEPVKEPTPAGVSFISAASIPNLDASGAGSPNDSIVAAQSPIEAAVNGVGAASRLPEPPPAPVVTPAPVMEVSAPVQPPTNMATMRPPSPSIVTTQAPPSMATSPAGSWFSKLFGGASTNGGRGFTPTGGGVTPGGLAYRTGTGLGGQPGLQWTNSKGQTVTAVENSFGQPGYSVGYG